MKKKIIAICLCVALVAVGIVGATLAYFTDTDSKTNTFTTANVKIELIEKQRNDDGTALEDFEDGKVLMPIVGSVQGEKDKFGLPTAENYVDKIVTVKNLASDAYVRVYHARPTALTGDTLATNILHMNDGNKFVAAGNKQDTQAINQNYTDYMGEETCVGTTTIDGIEYEVYYNDYNKVLTKDEETGAAFIIGLYLDKGVDAEETIVIDEDQGINPDGSWPTETVYTINGEVIDYDFSKGVNIPVFAVGVQADGFGSCAEAVTAAFGANFNPWAN